MGREDRRIHRVLSRAGKRCPLYVGSTDGSIYGIDAAGCGLANCPAAWTASIGSPITSSPAVANGEVFVGASDGTLHSFTLPGSSAGLSPTVQSISPSTGSYKGGTKVTITGSNFDLSSLVQFGGTPAVSQTLISGTELTAISPPGAIGPADVTVSTAAGTSTSVAADIFSYLKGNPPSISSISPTTGPAAGGTQVMIYGVDFDRATTVRFGDLPAASVAVLSGGRLRVIAPPAVAGTVDVSATTENGTSQVSGVDRYTYTP